MDATLTTQTTCGRPIFWALTHLAQAVVAGIALTSTGLQAQTNKYPPFSGPNEGCILPAAQYHSVNAHILRAILKVESNLNPRAVAKNDNGSFDVGIGQINSIHFTELAKHGIGPGQLSDPCVGTFVAAWHLGKMVARHGNTWDAIARYHSATPYFNRRYQALLWNELVQSGAIPGKSMPVPPLNNLEGAHPARPFFRKGSPNSNDSNVVVFDER